MSDVLARWNAMPQAAAENEILSCCGSKTWAHGMAAQRPIHNEATLLIACDEVCGTLRQPDWLEAFRSHPRIGDSHAPESSPAQSAAWSGSEQRNVAAANEDSKVALAHGNRAYEQRFNHIFIVCATGKSASEILDILLCRLRNDPDTELNEAAEQQRQITHLRLKKWLAS